MKKLSGSVRRLMVVGLPQGRAPILKRVRSVHENLTLNSALGLARPINLQRDLPVSEDMQRSGIMRKGKSKKNQNNILI
jgi:hypothetical protein